MTDTCGAPCPRHPGKVCCVAYAPKGMGRSVAGIPIVDASLRHSHTHFERGTVRTPNGDLLDVALTHGWGGGRHLFGELKGHEHRSITEAEYDTEARLRRVHDRAERLLSAIALSFAAAPTPETISLLHEIDPPEEPGSGAGVEPGEPLPPPSESA